MEFAAVNRKDLKALSALAQDSAEGYDFLDAKVLDAHSFGDPGYDGSFFLQAMEKGKPQGFILATVRRQGEQKTGHIKFFCIHPKARGRHLGNELFSEVERRFQKREAREIHVGLCPFPYLFSGVDSRDTATVCFLLSRGYDRQGDVVDMSADLARLDLALTKDEQQLAKEYKVRRAKPANFDVHLEPLRKAFPWWQPELRSALDKGGVFTAERDGQAVAFSAWGAANPGWFGPMGTLESERGKGLGRILLLKCLEALKKEGWKKALIPWVGPIPFYARHARASISRVGWHFLKRV
jgi:ribosomal protein S18 acetylase RimI-like enzyme